MIKKLSLKFVLVFLVLVVSVIITSSCYAAIPDIVGTTEGPFTIDELYEAVSSYGFTKDNSIVLAYRTKYETEESYRIYVFSTSEGATSLKQGFNLTHTTCTLYAGDSPVSSNYLSGNFNNANRSFSFSTGIKSGNLILGVCDSDGNPPLEIIDFSNVILIDYEGNVRYQPEQLDLSFDYSFEGIKRGQVKLEISNLDESLSMYGYVGLGTTFSIGDSLDITANTSNLRLLSYTNDNSELNCYLYEGEELNYYILDENNIILDTGYISEMAKGDFLYGFNVYNGVDFVFLRHGQVYWDDSLTFKYSIDSYSQHVNNNIVSMAGSSYITSDKTIASSKYNGYVYDSNNNLICEAYTMISNDLSSISITVDTSYYENNVGWNKSCYWLKSFTLSGTNNDGSNIDFSNYYVRWSVPTWLVLDSIEVNGEEYSKRNGIFNGFYSSGYSGQVNLQIYELIKDHIMTFDITLEVYDADDNLVLTHIVNSDNIIADKIKSEENNVDKGDYGILDNPNYTGGSTLEPDINNIQNWKADDFANLMSTDNFVWEFFKSILGNLPWWITTPLFILLFGVVIITLARFLRGA